MIPTVCMDIIILEENAKNSVESKRRMNPVIKEVVNKESSNGQMLGSSTLFLTVYG